MVKIFHNPRCRKSREGLQYLKDKNIEPQIVEYLKFPLSEKELIGLTECLGLRPKDFIRRQEKDFKQLGLKEKLEDDKTIIAAMASFPKLIERPIVVNNNNAVVARPANKIDAIL